MTPEAAELAANPRNIALVRSLVKRYSRGGWKRFADEFESAAYLALAEAANTFDPERGTSFYGHLSRRVYGAILDVIRAWTPAGYRRKGDAYKPETASLDQVDRDRDGRLKYETWLETEDEPIGWEIAYQEDLAALTKGLTPSEKEVIRGIFGRASRSPYRDAADRLGLSASSASKLYAEAIERLIYSHT